MKKYLFRWLYFTRSERIGTAVLCMVCVLGFAAPTLFRVLLRSNSTDFTQFQAEIKAFKQLEGKPVVPESATLFVFDPNTASLHQLAQLGLSEKTATSICKYREKGGQFSRPEDFKKIYTLTTEDYNRLAPYIQIGNGSDEPERPTVRPASELFGFDPNTASESDLRKLGLSQSAAKGILGYRAKGGQFRKKEDLQKIYALAEAEYERIAPFISLASSHTAQAGDDRTQPVTYSGGSTISGTKKFTGTLDINRASLEIWQQLPGIGEKRARQMLHFREKLGGFVSIEQVGETIGLPDSVFKQIKPMLVLETVNIRKINLNAVSKEDLATHPYCSEKQASLLVQFREQNGPYNSIHDLDKIAVFADPKWLSKIKPYLDVR